MESTADLLGQLDALGIVPPAHRAELSRLPSAQAGDPNALIAELADRGWISQAQASALYSGQPESLRLGDFVLVDEVGKGGMGTVYKARHHGKDELVCLKVVHPELVSSKKLVRRFQREIWAGGQMNSPYVVTAYGEGECHGKLFYIMEFVDGMDLGRLIQQRGALPVKEACDYVRQAALGLQAAHELNLIHRDVKPDNFLLETARGRVKLLDLGLCRVEDGGGENLTVAGTALGTAEYMAPEQIRDSTSVDARSDLYALGCTFYYLLTGQDPFRHRNPAMVMQMQLTQEPTPVEQFRNDVPPAVLGVLRKLMAKKREDRYQTAAEVVVALEKAMRADKPAGGKLNPAKTPAKVAGGSESTGGSSMLTVVAALVILAVTAAGVAYWYFYLRR